MQERNYVVVKSRVLFPEFRGRMVSAFLSDHFSEVTDYSFTADMENELDNVSAGTTEWKGLLKDYWARFSMYCKDAGKVEIRQVEKMLGERYGKFLFASLPNKDRICPSCSQGTLVFKVSRFGAGYFIGCDQHPKCKYIAKTMYSEDDDVVDPQKPESSFKPKLLGVNPGSNEKIYLKNGPYGFYIQLGDDRKGYSPKRASISQDDCIRMCLCPLQLEPGPNPLESDPNQAQGGHLSLADYVIHVAGKTPEDQQPVVLKVSKFGFSIKHRRTIAPVPKNVNPENVTLEKALKLLLSKDAKRCGRPKGKPRVEEAMEAMFSQ
ncbi:DNA topoisomerase 1 isoform X1 [Cinnamomum micranthum f. kanehirae]|uniref:DNA topoisomerase 1 isoform X1 n=1 Tax=Cinnamomum micranthum f. kanehirae TaxID=337451 RepID=A0A3S3NCL8_9MAGN|nr:DNA topoisomerase 1 isoform X1 [Cinnamomum micranthum f. kanehirae]